MKKLLFGILTFLGIGLSFCSADYYFSGYNYKYSYDGRLDLDNCSIDNCNLSNITYFFYYYNDNLIFNNKLNDPMCMGVGFGTFYNSDIYSQTEIPCLSSYLDSHGEYNFVCGQDLDGGYTFDSCSLLSSTPSEPSVPEITVYYNNGNSSESIECDGVQAIEIQGLSTITSTNTFTPYYNISYTDEDNQKLTESYSKDILYLENGQFKKTYTGNNDWILTVQGNDSENTFTGYVPVFDVTGSTQPIDTDYNMFNNFTDNSLKVLLSNIPGYIQYVFIIGIILFLLGIVKMFKRRK